MRFAKKQIGWSLPKQVEDNLNRLNVFVLYRFQCFFNSLDTAAVAKEFKVFYEKVPGSTPDSYTMNHTAGLFVFDTQGRIRLFSRYGAGPKALEDDIRALLRESA